MDKPDISWIEISTCTNAEISEWLETAFLENNALAITFQDSDDEQPIFEPALGETPLWASTQLTALYQLPIDIDQTILAVQLSFNRLCDHQHPFPQWQVQKIADQDWERIWLDNFQPLQFGHQFWVVPSWLEPPFPEATSMKLDPGLAFGTGSHETTSLCLSWLAENCSILKRENLHLIDYGCGSGILAVASAKLGAKKVTAIDIDPQAIIATRQNSDLNSMQNDQLKTLLVNTEGKIINNKGESKELIQQADIIIANILCEPLIQLADYFRSLLKKDGSMILSGILSNQADLVIKTYEQWVTFDPVTMYGEWALLTGSKKSTGSKK